MGSPNQSIISKPIREEFKKFTEKIPSLEYQAACQYLLIKPIKNAYSTIIHNLNYSTDFKVYPDDSMNTFEMQLSHSIRTRMAYITQVDETQQEIFIKASAALKALNHVRTIVQYWDQTLSLTEINIPIHFVPKVNQHLSDKVNYMLGKKEPHEIVMAIYQEEIDKICEKFQLKPIKINDHNFSSS